MSTKYVSAPTFYLAGAGVVVGATSITLQSFSDIYGNVLTMTDFGALGYASIEPDSSNEEQITFSGVTPNANGTFTLTGINSTLAKSPYTAASGTVRGHSGGVKFVITDSVSFWSTFTNKNNDETIAGQWTFTNTPLSPTSVSDASTTVKGISKSSVAPAVANNPIFVGDNDPRVPSQGENDALVGTSGTPSSSNKFVTNADTSGSGAVVRTSLFKFGGTGADGALTITSGATNIDCANAAVVTKNYTSISITGTASLTFTNPNINGTIIILKSQGDVTLTSSATPMIDVSGMGSTGGAGKTIGASTSDSGSNGNDGYGFTDFKTNFGVGGTGTGGAGTAGALPTFYPSIKVMRVNTGKYSYVIPGASGGGGGCQTAGGGSATSGTGGRGGGSLIIECGGAWNFTTSSGISVNGKVGTNGGGAGFYTAGGGGGGAGGMLIAFYNSLTANTGTITVAGGAGGDGSGNGYTTTGGGGAGSAFNAGVVGGTGSTSGTCGGGAGGNGYSLVALNTEFN
jgi:hypothetical protein